MVLIPEERLLRYEERDKQRTENRDGIMYGGGEDSEETRVVIDCQFSVNLISAPPLE